MEKPNVDPEKADQKEFVKKATDTILQESIDVHVTVNRPSILHKIGLKKTKRVYYIPPINLGSLERVSNVLNSIEFHDLDTLTENENIETHTILGIGIKNMADKNTINAMVKVIAIAIMNRNPDPPNLLIRLYIRFKEKRIAQFLKWNLSALEIQKILTAVIKQMEVQDFLGSTVSIGKMNLMETRKKQTSGASFRDSLNTSDSVETKSSGNGVGQT